MRAELHAPASPPCAAGSWPWKQSAPGSGTAAPRRRPPAAASAEAPRVQRCAAEISGQSSCSITGKHGRCRRRGKHGNCTETDRHVRLMQQLLHQAAHACSGGGSHLGGRHCLRRSAAAAGTARPCRTHDAVLACKEGCQAWLTCMHKQAVYLQRRQATTEVCGGGSNREAGGGGGGGG